MAAIAIAPVKPSRARVTGSRALESVRPELVALTVNPTSGSHFPL